MQVWSGRPRPLPLFVVPLEICHPERRISVRSRTLIRSRGTCCSPTPATPHQGIRTRRDSHRRQPRQTPAPKGRKKTAQDEVQDEVQDASPDEVLGKQEKRPRPRRDQHSNHDPHTHPGRYQSQSCAHPNLQAIIKDVPEPQKGSTMAVAKLKYPKEDRLERLAERVAKRDQRARRQNSPRGARQGRFKNCKDRHSSAASNSLIATSISSFEYPHAFRSARRSSRYTVEKSAVPHKGKSPREVLHSIAIAPSHRSR